MWWLVSPTLAEEPQCQLLGPFALIVQAFMGGIAILSLVYKRNHETPRRPLWIWFFDVLKQVVGSTGLHFMNLLFSMFFSEFTEPGVDRNPCTWYFLNVLVDTTVGVPVLWFFLFLVHSTAFRMGVSEIVSGVYGAPPRWGPFIKQASLYMLAMVLMKLVLYAFFWWMPFIDDLGQFLISWTDFDTRVQVAFVMLIFPLVMNTVQYYLIDTIIQAHEYHKVPLVIDGEQVYGTMSGSETDGNDQVNDDDGDDSDDASIVSTPPSFAKTAASLESLLEEDQLKRGNAEPEGDALRAGQTTPL